MSLQLDKTGTKALQVAKQEAKQLCNKYAGTEHLLLGILSLKDQTIFNIFKKMNVDTADIKQVVYDNVYQTSTVDVELKQIRFTPRVNKILEIADECARKLGRKHVGVEHIFLGLLYEQNGVAVNVLKSFGVSFRRVKREFHKQMDPVLPLPKPNSKNFGDVQIYKNEFRKYPTLTKHGVNLTILAKEGKLDTVIGREKEVERVMQVISRKTKSNPVLVGEAGVGKTAIIELLAQKIADGNVPDQLIEKHIVTIDLASVVAGTKYRGQFEDRMKKILDEVKAAKEMIIFIDEVHTVINAGAAQGSLDAGNILKPALARGEFVCIGATTPTEYVKHIEKDKALDRRFQQVTVEPPTAQEALVILRGIKKDYETYHGVKYSAGALKVAIELSQRYIGDRNLPDSAIDILDEAGAKQNVKKSVDVITEEQIEDIVSSTTGVPIISIDTDIDKFFRVLEKSLKKDIVSQRHVLKKLCDTLKSAHAHLNDPNQPLGTFMFLGATGVGKTYVCKQLAKYLFGSDNRLLRLDMSEFMESHAVSKLTGSPPGYVGHEDHPGFLENVRKYPYSLILMDEIEKAHPQVLNLLLQILDEGHLTDSHGRKINFKNTVVVMTSNLGTDVYEEKSIGFVAPEETDKHVDVKKQAIKDLRPEFVNRIDDIIVFDLLTQKDLKEIANLQCKIFAARVKANYNIRVTFDDNVVDFIVELGDNKSYGAREIKRNFRKHVENKLAEYLVSSKSRGKDLNVIFEKDIIKIKESS